MESQKLYGLLPNADPREAMHPERFHATRHQQEKNGPTTPDKELWAELPREALLKGAWDKRSLHRVALTTDAGIGKTYNLRYLDYELNTPGQRVVAFTLKIGDLKSVVELIPCLVSLVHNAPGNTGSNADRQHRELIRKRNNGQIVLLFDGLDQASDTSVGHLAALLHPESEWANCRIVVAGRPFAIDRYCDRLFEGMPWQFVQIAEFDQKQQRAVLGKLDDGSDRFDSIPPDAQSLLTVPRVLEYVRSLPAKELTDLHAVSDVYWKATGHMLTEVIGKSNQSTLESKERYRALLGALAFGMYSQTKPDPKTHQLRPNLDRVWAFRMTGFKEETHTRLKKAFANDGRGEYLRDKFDSDCERLCGWNAWLNHGWLDGDAVGDPYIDLLWRNASLQEFFAAYWATRWGTPEDLKQLRDWIVNPHTEENNGFYWFWRYASEMPDASLNTERTPKATWVKAMTPLYDQAAVRSTEFIYRSWDRMKQTRSSWYEKRETHPQSIFLAEFQDLHKGKRGSVNQQQIARDMMKGFIALVGTEKPNDNGTFLMGAGKDDTEAHRDEKPQHEVTLKPFRLHKCCVTNVEYELFDPSHEEKRWIEIKHPLAAKTPGGDGPCPVVHVRWYDAFCFAVWCGCELPTEEEWEYANRAGTETPYAVGDGYTLTHGHCHFGQDLTSGYTISVDGKPPNGWGLFQMTGNVWEWCQDWYDQIAYTKKSNKYKTIVRVYRVLRGGSWLNRAGDCRAAIRDGDEPRSWNLYGGFRLRLPGPG